MERRTFDGGGTPGHRTGRLIERRLGLRISLAAGLWPGLAGGLAAAITLVVCAMLEGIEPTAHLRSFAGTIVGLQSTLPAEGPVWLGILVLALGGLVLAPVYTRVVRLTTRGRAVGLGLLYGVALWLLTQQLLFPLLVPQLSERLTTWAWLAALFAYGLVLGSTSPAIERVASRPFVPLRRPQTT